MTDVIPVDLQMKISSWRQRADELTLEEMQEAIKQLRQGRVQAAAASQTVKRKTAKAAIPSADDLLSDLEGL